MWKQIVFTTRNVLEDNNMVGQGGLCSGGGGTGVGGQGDSASRSADVLHLWTLAVTRDVPFTKTGHYTWKTWRVFALVKKKNTSSTATSPINNSFSEIYGSCHRVYGRNTNFIYLGVGGSLPKIETKKGSCYYVRGMFLRIIALQTATAQVCTFTKWVSLRHKHCTGHKKTAIKFEPLSTYFPLSFYQYLTTH